MHSPAYTAMNSRRHGAGAQRKLLLYKLRCLPSFPRLIVRMFQLAIFISFDNDIDMAPKTFGKSKGVSKKMHVSLMQRCTVFVGEFTVLKWAASETMDGVDLF